MAEIHQNLVHPQSAAEKEKRSSASGQVSGKHDSRVYQILHQARADGVRSFSGNRLHVGSVPYHREKRHRDRAAAEIRADRQRKAKKSGKPIAIRERRSQVKVQAAGDCRRFQQYRAVLAAVFPAFY